MSQQNQPQTPRRRRSDRYQAQGGAMQPGQEAPLRANYPREDAAPMPLGGYDAAQPGQPGGARPTPQVYEESNYPPPQAAYRAGGQPVYDDYDDDDLPPRRWPLILLAVLLLLAFVVIGPKFLVPRDTKGLLGQARDFSSRIVDGGLALVGLKKSEPPRLIKFDTPESQVQTGVKTVFTFTTSQAVDDVRIRDEVNNDIAGVKEAVDAPNNTTWTLTTKLTKPQSILLSADIKVGNTWYLTDKTIQLTVVEPTAIPTPLTPPPTATPTAFATATLSGAAVQGQDAAPTDSAVVTMPAPPATATQPVTLAGLLPVFTQAPQAGAGQTGLAAPEEAAPLADEPAAEALPEDAMADPLDEFPEEELPADMMAEAPADAAAENAAPSGDTAQTDSQPAAQPSAQPTATPMPQLVVAAAENQAPGQFKFVETAYQGSKKQADFQRAEPISVQGGELYTYYPGGVFTFRSDGMRQNAAFGTADMPIGQMSIHWQADVGSLRTSDDTLYGLGWTGQPAIIKWSVEVRSGMNLLEGKKDVKALKEVIFAAQDGKVYFLDLADGQPTRGPIEIGYPLKGSVAVDPLGRPLITFGQGVSKMPGKTGDIGFYIYNLIDQSKAFFINGRQTKSQIQYSTNGAFDGTALFDRFTDNLVVVGENGLLYTAKMNTVFDFKAPTSLTVDPEVTYLRAKTGKQQNMTVSVEGSAAMYGPYAFYADRQGILRCVDTTAMKTLWVFDTGDNTDATPALDLNADNSLSLYTGTTVFSRTRKGGVATLRRINALTGEQAWAVEVPAKYDVAERGGLKASPVVGQGQISDLVIFTVNLTEDGASVIALNKQTGAQAWKVPVPGGAISSPVAVYREDGQARIVQAGLDGTLYLLDGRSGQVLHTLALGGRIEGSPAVYNDILVIGTSSRDNSKIYGIRLE